MKSPKKPHTKNEKITSVFGDWVFLADDFLSNIIIGNGGTLLSKGRYLPFSCFSECLDSLELETTHIGDVKIIGDYDAYFGSKFSGEIKISNLRKLNFQVFSEMFKQGIHIPGNKIRLFEWAKHHNDKELLNYLNE